MKRLIRTLLCILLRHPHDRLVINIYPILGRGDDNFGVQIWKDCPCGKQIYHGDVVFVSSEYAKNIVAAEQLAKLSEGK